MININSVLWVVITLAIIGRVKLLQFELERFPRLEKNSTSTEQFYPYLFKLEIGTPPQTLNIIFDSASHFMWVSGDSFNSSKSTTYNASEPGAKNISTISNSSVNAIPSEDTVWISNIDMNFTFPFLLATENTFKYFNADGILGIAKDYSLQTSPNIYNNIKYSLLNYLNLQSKTFSLVHTEQNKGILYLGEVDESIFNSQDTSNCTCNIRDPSSTENLFYDLWNCNISMYSIDKEDSELSKAEVAVFSAGEEFIYAPSGTGEIILSKYLKLLNKKNELCTIEDNKLFCDKFDYDYLPDFALILDGNIRITGIGEDMFKNYNDTHYLFKIVIDTKRKYWVVGEPIIKNYNFLFDLENGKIGIVPYSKVGFILLLIFILVGITMMLLFIGLIFTNYGKKDKTLKFS